MRIVLQTPAELVVHDGRWKTVLNPGRPASAYLVRVQHRQVVLTETHLVPVVTA